MGLEELVIQAVPCLWFFRLREGGQALSCHLRAFYLVVFALGRGLLGLRQARDKKLFFAKGGIKLIDKPRHFWIVIHFKRGLL